VPSVIPELIEQSAGESPSKAKLLTSTATSPESEQEPQPSPLDYTQFDSAPPYPIDNTRTDAADDPRPPQRAIQQGQARAPPGEPPRRRRGRPRKDQSPLKSKPARPPFFAGEHSLLTVEELSIWWAISVSALNAARTDGTGPRFIRLLGGEDRHGAVRYRLADCLAYIQARSVANTSEPKPELDTSQE
jgi:hypothetical protein